MRPLAIVGAHHVLPDAAPPRAGCRSYESKFMTGASHRSSF